MGRLSYKLENIFTIISTYSNGFMGINDDLSYLQDKFRNRRRNIGTISRTRWSSSCLEDSTTHKVSKIKAKRTVKVNLVEKAMAVLKTTEELILNRKTQKQKQSSFANFVGEELEKIEDNQLQSNAKWEMQCILRKYLSNAANKENIGASSSGWESSSTKSSNKVTESNKIHGKGQKVQVLSIETVPMPFSSPSSSSSLFSPLYNYLTTIM